MDRSSQLTALKRLRSGLGATPERMEYEAEELMSHWGSASGADAVEYLKRAVKMLPKKHAEVLATMFGFVYAKKALEGRREAYAAKVRKSRATIVRAENDALEALLDSMEGMPSDTSVGPLPMRFIAAVKDGEMTAGFESVYRGYGTGGVRVVVDFNDDGCAVSVDDMTEDKQGELRLAVSADGLEVSYKNVNHEPVVVRRDWDNEGEYIPCILVDFTGWITPTREAVEAQGDKVTVLESLVDLPPREHVWTFTMQGDPHWLDDVTPATES